MNKKYKMTISRLTVDKLGVKLYDRVSAVIAEIIANSYDADATEVVITAPMGEMLARKQQGTLIDQGLSIEVSDNGSGMLADGSVNEINDFYLRVGAERRNDPRRGDKSKEFGRRVMGRKGVGKLAPFGVCQKIEVISSGGKQINGKDERGKPKKGFTTSHLILDRKEILSETDKPYYPQPGPLDEAVQPKRGTTIKMKVFDHRRVPRIADFERQMAQKFGLATPNWRIILRDSGKKPSDPDYERIVGAFETKLKPGTKIVFKRRPGAPADSQDPKGFEVKPPDGVDVGDAAPGFTLEGKFYPVTGWVGYARDPYKDDLMAGVRIYCRGKIAAQTAVFNMKAGFTGEHDVRSYLIGELHADWLDEDDDLIRTDRQDILWSHDLGQGFQAWGQSVVRLLGRITREPMRRSAWERFQQISKISERVAQAYPGPQQGEIRKRTIEMAETIAKSARGDELEDEQTVESFVQLSLLLGPHITLDEKLKEASEKRGHPLGVISEILKTARIAELASFGRIADDRVRVIKQVEQYKDDPTTLESAFQKLITVAPWLVNPQWSPITANQSFATLKAEFVKFYKERTNEDLNLDSFSEEGKRADFVMSNQDQVIEIVEIKRPKHSLENAEMERINKYIDLMEEFLNLDGNKEFKNLFPKYHVTLVCDKLGLSGVHRAAFDGLARNGIPGPYQLANILASYKENAREFSHGSAAAKDVGGQRMKSRLTAIDLFAGSGGLTRGLWKAGFDVRAAVEVDPTAARTYRKNHPQTALIERDICKVSATELKALCDDMPVALVAGCAPCQGFCSLTAKNNREDARNELVLRMATFIEELKPEAVMMENVPGLEHRGARIFGEFVARLRTIGYQPEWRVVQMADYGVQQSRRRLVLFAGLGFKIPFPEATHAKDPPPRSKLRKWLTLREVIAKQPKPVTLSKAREKGGPRRFNWHVVRDLQPQVTARLNAAIPGKTWLTLDESIRPECHRGGYEGFTNTYGRMSWSQTPVTITGGCTTPCKGRFGHPDKSRTTISVREAALIQTFPCGYKFETDYMETVCDMIGNAVPPKFAAVAGKRIREELEKRHELLARS